MTHYFIFVPYILYGILGMNFKIKNIPGVTGAFIRLGKWIFSKAFLKPLVSHFIANVSLSGWGIMCKKCTENFKMSLTEKKPCPSGLPCKVSNTICSQICIKHYNSQNPKASNTIQ